jgi:hypothetical protein
LNFYLNSIGLLFFGKTFNVLSFIFLAKIFILFLVISALIETKKLSLFVNVFCLAFLFYYLRDYIIESYFLFNDDLYTLNFLLFLYFTIKEEYLWCGVYLFLASIVRFPGYFLSAFFLLFYVLFFRVRDTARKQRIGKALIFSFLGMLLVNVVYPAYINGFSRWAGALYYENLGAEHFSNEYAFSLSRFFQFIFRAARYGFFTAFLVLFNRDRISVYLLLGIIPYVIFLAAVENPQLHYMFPIVSVTLVSGMRVIGEIKSRMNI